MRQRSVTDGEGRLVVTRKVGDEIRIDGPAIIEIRAGKGGKVTLAILKLLDKFGGTGHPDARKTD